MQKNLTNKVSVSEAIRIVRNECPNEYARAYAEQIGESIIEEGTGGLCAQIRYILANTGNWRGERARVTKGAMRDYLARHKR